MSTYDSHSLWYWIVWHLLFIPQVFTSIVGNLTVVWIVCTQRRMCTTTNIYLLGLTAADVLVATVNVVPNYIYILKQHWYFGNTLCRLSQFWSVAAICASIYTLTAIALDRYQVIMYPLRRRGTRRKAVLTLIGIWTFSLLIAFPNWFNYTTTSLTDEETNKHVICYQVWPDGSQGSSRLEIYYSYLILIVAYIIPTAIMVYAYTGIGYHLWGSKSIGEATRCQTDSIKKKKKVVIMLISVVSVFVICWFPYHLYFILTSTFPSLLVTEHVQSIYLAIYWCAMSNSMINPLVYYALNKKFRTGFQTAAFTIFGLRKLLQRNNFERQNVVTRRADSRNTYRGTTSNPVESTEMVVLTNNNNGASTVRIEPTETEENNDEDWL